MCVLRLLIILACLPVAALTGAPQTVPAGMSPYNIIWDSQSVDSADSMPLSGGILGLNVWVEKNDLFFLIGSPNCLDESGMQMKLGRVRLRFNPAVFASEFRQELRLDESEIVISGKAPSGAPLTVRMWCDVNQPVIHLATRSGDPVDMELSYESWAGQEAKAVDGGIQWVRRMNPGKNRRAKDMKSQGMDEFAAAIPDPLTNLISGGRILADGMIPGGAGVAQYGKLKLKTLSLKTPRPVKTMDVCVVLRMEQDQSPDDWEKALAAATTRAAATRAADKEQTHAWWKEFWNRSRIVINPGRNSDDAPWTVGRNYQLFRYQLAANRGGRMMTLFNGGGFTCEGNPDSRMWANCQNMAQNQRMVYWPMLRSGDFDLLKVALDFYADRTPMRRLHARKFWGVDGVTYPEPFSVFGLDALGTTVDGRCRAKHLPYHYTSGMEFALMMLEYGRYTGIRDPRYTDPAEGIITYYDQFYQKSLAAKSASPLDANGQLVIYPSDACEPFHGCTNNTDVIAGLMALSDALLELPDGALPAGKREYIRAFRKRIPPIPVVEDNQGHRVIAPAQSWEWVFYNGNMDFPNMYVCFPFNIYSLGRDDAGIALPAATWDFGAIRPKVQRQGKCWYQSAITLARLGRTAEAETYTREKFLHASARFPAFWRNPRFCQMPDTDHGGSAMTGLQEMLMQCDGRRILLAPAWPAAWDCDFKLVAPYQTSVEGQLRGGRFVNLRVTPPEREKDVVQMTPK